MKKAMFILSTVLLFGILSSCSTEDLTVKKNWIFTITTVSTTTPDLSGIGPITQITTLEQDGQTEIEAEATRKGMEGTQTTTVGDITMTIKITVTKAVKTN